MDLLERLFLFHTELKMYYVYYYDPHTREYYAMAHPRPRPPYRQTHIMSPMFTRFIL